MHARVVSGTILDGTLEQGMTIVQGEVLAELQKIDGFAGADLLIDGYNFMLITWWTACPVGIDEVPSVFASILSYAQPVLQGTPSHDRYERVWHHGMTAS